MSEKITLCEEKMQKTLKNLESEYLTIRAGRANPNMLDGISWTLFILPLLSILVVLVTGIFPYYKINIENKKEPEIPVVSLIIVSYLVSFVIFLNNPSKLTYGNYQLFALVS